MSIRRKWLLWISLIFCPVWPQAANAILRCKRKTSPTRPLRISSRGNTRKQRSSTKTPSRLIRNSPTLTTAWQSVF